MKRALLTLMVLVLAALAYWSTDRRVEPAMGAPNEVAATLAVDLANRETLQRFGVKPFRPEGGVVSVEGNQWSWSEAKGYGCSDLRATVSVVQGKAVVQIDQLSLETWE